MLHYIHAVAICNVLMANRNRAVIGEDDGVGVDGGLVQNVLVAHVPVLIIMG